MPAIDIFNSNAFSTVELTNAINVVPNTFGRLQQMNLFPGRGVRTTTVALERKNGVLNLLPTGERGAPGTVGAVGKRDLRHFEVSHILHSDSVLADDVQNVRAFGSENQMQAVQELVNEKLTTMRAKHDITLEYHRW